MKRRGGRKRKGVSKRVPARKPMQPGWLSTDEEEVEIRKLRASTESFAIDLLEPDIEFYGTFRVRSKAGTRSYTVEIRALLECDNSCECPDFRGNGLGTCKHVEAVLARLRKGRVRLFKQASSQGSPRVEVFLSRGEKPHVCIAWPARSVAGARKIVEPFFSSAGALLGDAALAVPALERALKGASRRVQRRVRIAHDVIAHAADLRRRKEQLAGRQAFLDDVAAGKRSIDFLSHPLYPYQQEGMLHLTFGRRVMLADDMGLGKTVQAIAACELLRRTHQIERVLIVCPASLKAEWEEQIEKFAGAHPRIIAGSRAHRLNQYREPAFHYITNYEQIRVDFADINAIMAPDVVILDEAQRIKNWQTKTAKCVKQLTSPYAFVLTGTPLENRIDDIYSIVEFLDPELFGSLFRFNREFYQLDEMGRPTGYRNLDALHRRVRRIMLRRRKADVEDQLPARTVNMYSVPMHPEQRERYEEFETKMVRLVAIAKRRTLRKEEMDRLQRYLACMRMLCDTPYILDQECRVCPKLGELEAVLEEVMTDRDAKVLVFSEWERMLRLVRDLAGEMGLGFAWHTGSVPQTKRRKEIRRFKDDPDCRLFLSTDSGSTGLNLQAANVVINLDLPWNPAKLEQRIARAWRKHQTRAVSVIHLVSEESIEHRMLSTLANKQELADSVVDGLGDAQTMPLPSGRQALVERLEALMGVSADRGVVSQPVAAKPVAPVSDPYEAFREDLAARIDDRLLLIEARQDEDGNETLFAVVDGDVEQVRPLAARLARETFAGAGKTPAAVELVDRANYELIQRLIDSGVLQFGPRSVREIHRADGFGETAASGARQRTEKAQSLLTAAERRMQMARVLAAGGFPVEALPALGEASEGLLHSLVHLDTDCPEAEPLALSRVNAQLVKAGLLPEKALATVARLRDASGQPGELTENDARELLVDVTTLFECGREAVNRRALK